MTWRREERTQEDSARQGSLAATLDSLNQYISECESMHLDEVAERFRHLKNWWERDFIQVNPESRGIPESVCQRSTGPMPRIVGLALDDIKGDYHALLLPAGDFLLDAWTCDAPYLDILKEARTSERYGVYMDLRREFGQRSAFYLDAADLFEGWKEHGLALRILSNLAGLGPEDPSLLRILGRRLGQMGEHKLSIATYEKCVQIQETPNGLRDLALACEADGQYQRALDLLYRVITLKWDHLFQEIEDIALQELNALATRHPVDTSKVDPRLLAPIPVDIRVLLSWENAETDMELQVTDPHGETCMYNHARTLLGGRMLRDFTSGLGPEQFLLRKAVPGMYKIQVCHHGARRPELDPSSARLHLEFYHQYGTPWQTRKDLILRVEGRGSVLLGGKIEPGVRDSWEMLISPFGNTPCGKIVNIST